MPRRPAPVPNGMEIVPFQFSHVDSFLRSAKGEGWISTERELTFLISNYSDGCFVVLDAGQPTAFITSIRYPKSAWIGNLLVLPEYRQRGLGRMLLEKVLHCLDLAGCATVWLTASTAGAYLYRSVGFVQIDRVQRWKGAGGIPFNRNKPAYISIAGIDSMGWGDDRWPILEALPEDYGCFKAADGFMLYSASGDGLQIGPWGALSSEAAVTLFDAATGSEAAKVEILLDVPEKNRAAGELLAARGFSLFGSTLLMYRGRLPRYRPEFIYACASMGSYG